jgi:hypothetical protein
MKIQYAKIIPGLEIDGRPAPYPVVNGRAVRATAGIMFLLGFSTFTYTLSTHDYQFVKILVPLFWLDFFLKAVFTPEWSIFGVFGRFMVRKQKPEFVGAIQKRFAWSIGLFLASTMAILALMMGVRGLVPIMICSTCLFFMYMESVFGICVGCKIYQFLHDRELFIKKPEHKPACPGGVCSVK